MTNTHIADPQSPNARNALGAPPAIPPLQAAPGQYLTFMLGSEIFGLDILSVKEIIEYGAPTKVPMMPAFISGVINLRGGVVPVIDLTALFEQAVTAVTRRTCIVIVELEIDPDAPSRTIGVLVDSVSAVVDIAAADIKPEPAFGMRICADFISGIAQRDERFIILLNILRVLAMAELAIPQGRAQSQRNGSDATVSI